MRSGIQNGMQNGTDSLDDRLARRRVRRWSRRAKIAGPLLAVPAILALLILSVDLIEYQPQKQSRRASERPAPIATRHSATHPDAIVVEPQSVSSLSVVDSTLSSASPLAMDTGMGMGMEIGSGDPDVPGAGR